VPGQHSAVSNDSVSHHEHCIKGGADMMDGYGMIGCMFWFVVVTGLLSVSEENSHV